MEDYLKNHWETYSDKELARVLNTTEGAIIAKRRRLKLLRKELQFKNTKKYTYIEVLELFEEKGYILLEKEYKNYTTKMKYICKKHEDYGVQTITLRDLLRNRGCYMCGRERTINSHKHPDSYWIKLCEERNFIFVGTYVKNNSTYIRYICKNHIEQGVQEKFAGNFLKCFNCPFCKASHNEVVISTILDKWGIKFIHQKRFDGCKDKYTLPFDFYLYDFNILIEYDGEFHYQCITLNGKIDRDLAMKNLIETQKRDKIKSDFCKDNDILLIRIPFWEQEDIESILFDHFVKCGILIET